MDRKDQLIRIGVIVAAVVLIAAIVAFQLMGAGTGSRESNAPQQVVTVAPTAVIVSEPASQGTTSQGGSSIVDVMAGGQMTARPPTTPGPTRTPTPTAEPTPSPTPRESEEEETGSSYSSTSILNMMEETQATSAPAVSESDSQNSSESGSPAVISSIYDEDGNYRRLVKIGSRDVDVMQTPSSSAVVFGTAKANQTYPVLHISSNGWYEIMLESGVMGYINSSGGTLIQ